MRFSFIVLFLVFVAPGCSVKEQASEEPVEIYEDESEANESVPVTLFEKLKWEINVYQSKKNNGLNPDFNITGLLELPEKYSSAEFMLVYEDSDSQIQFSLITFEGEKKIYYLASCSADSEKAVIAKVGETNEDSNYHIVALPCHECEANAWVVYKTGKDNVPTGSSNPRVFKYINSKFLVNTDFVKPQAELNSLLNHFKLNRDSYHTLTYDENWEYESVSKSYFYSEKNLEYFFSDFGVEGGEGHSELILFEHIASGGKRKTYLNTSYLEDGFFSYEHGGEMTSYSVFPVGRIPPVISGTNVAKQIEYESEMNKHWKVVSENQTRFKLVNGQYEFYVKRDTVKSEYGLEEVYQRYRIDSVLLYSIHDRGN